MILRGLEIVGEEGPPRSVVVAGERIAPGGSEAGRGSAIDFDGAIAFPGLVNSHDHLEFDVYPRLGHRHYADYLEWGEDIHRRDAATIEKLEKVPRSVRVRWGALRNVLCGVTAVAHHGPSADARETLPVELLPGTSIHSVNLAPRWRLKLNAPLARAPYVFHLGEGTSVRAKQEVDEVLRWNLWRRPVVAVHALAMRAAQAERFLAVVWCPVSNEFLYGANADVASLKEHTSILFGTDSTLTGDWNIWEHLRRARALGVLDDRELFAAATRRAARIWRRGAATLAPGQPADLVVARKKASDRWNAFFAVDPEDILLELKRGRVVLSDSVVDVGGAAGPASSLRLGEREKRVSEDVDSLVARLRAHGVEPNIPLVPLSNRTFRR